MDDLEDNSISHSFYIPYSIYRLNPGKDMIYC